MKVVCPICCGVDTHKSFLVATIIKTLKDNLKPSYQKKSFSTFNSDLNRFADWSQKNRCLDVCMESTGKYWVPIVYHSGKVRDMRCDCQPQVDGCHKGKQRWHQRLQVDWRLVPPQFGEKATKRTVSKMPLLSAMWCLILLYLDRFGESATRITDYPTSDEDFDP